MTNSSELERTNKRGRKPILVDWPNGEFTAKEFLQLNENKMSRASAHSKINQAVDYGQVTLVRKVNPDIGRPINVYRVSPPSESI
tara:strand:- start:8388 stop:8642 length:255 start_codon:yes stop_codon:yes gene_type:complete